MADKRFITVPPKDFARFLDNHPELERNTHTICDPLMISYNTSEGLWPDSMIARCWPEKNEFEIREDYFNERVGA